MNNSELIDYVVTTTGLKKKDVKVALASIVEGATKTLRLGGSVIITNLGRLSVAAVPLRRLKNPRTGDLMLVGARKAVKFRPCDAIKITVNKR